MKRYDCYDYGDGLIEDEDGRYVEYSEAGEAIATYKRMYVQELKQNTDVKESLEIVYKSLLAKDYLAAIELLSEILEGE